MKKVLSIISLCFLLSDCKKPESAPAINGKWKYESNVKERSCTDLVGAVCEIKNGEATLLSVPELGIYYGYRVGDKLLTNITQTTSPNSFSGIGYTRNYWDGIQDRDLPIEIVIQANGQEMIQTYPFWACFPVQKWVKVN